MTRARVEGRRGSPNVMVMRTDYVPVGPGIEMAADTWGGSARAYVLVHGLASNARLWDGVARELAAHGHRTITIDQRGHGRSSKPADGYDFVSITNDLASLLDRMDVTEPVIVGQSWGGNVVIEFAARFPGRAHAIAAIDGGAIELGRQFPDWSKCAQALAPPELDGVAFSRLESVIRANHPDWPEAGIAGTLANFEVRPDGTVRPWLSRANHMLILRALWEHKPSERFGSISDTVLFIPARDRNGGRATTTDAIDGALKTLADGRVLWMEGDHDLHAQHPAAVAKALMGLA